MFYGFDEDIQNQCLEELEEYLSMWADLSMDLRDEFRDLTGKRYWNQYGSSDFPLLSTIANRLFQVPTSSAAAERVWSVFSYIHSKRRNRLKNEKVEKMAYCYINYALLDQVDNVDYQDYYREDY